MNIIVARKRWTTRRAVQANFDTVQSDSFSKNDSFSVSRQQRERKYINFAI